MTTAIEITNTKAHYKNLRIKFNVRYGLDEERLLSAYEQGIDELKDSILKWGFKPNEPIEVYDSGETDVEGLPIYDITEGHRRYLASLSIFEENLGKALGDDLAPGEVRIFVAPRPENLLKLVSAQIGANRTEPNTKMDLCKAIDAAFNSMDGKKTEKLNQIGEELGMTRQTVASHYDVYQLPVVVKDWIQSSEIDDSVAITISFTVASEMVNYYKVEDASKLLQKALEIVQTSPEEVKTFGKAVTRDWLYELAAKIKLGGKPPRKKTDNREAQTSDNDNQSGNTDSDSPIDGNTVAETPDESTDTKSGVKPENQTSSTEASNSATSGEKSDTGTNKKAQSPAQSKTPIERIETQIRQALKGDIGLAIANGIADVTRNVLTIEIPLDKGGAEFAELVSVFIDPVSNPPEQVLSPTSVIENMEF